MQIADFGMSRVLADDKTHVSTDTHGRETHLSYKHRVCHVRLLHACSCQQRTALL